MKFNPDNFVQHKTIVVPDDVEFYVLGDIHGCYDLMMQALKLAGYSEKRGDYVFCVGDLIDRGPDNLKVLGTFLYNKRFHSVMGNHDFFMANDDYDNWMYNGGTWVIKDGLDTDTIQGIAEDMANKLPFFITVEHRGYTYGICHAGIPFQYPASGTQPETPNWFKLTNIPQTWEYLQTVIWDRNVIEEVCFSTFKEQLSSDPYFNRFATAGKQLPLVVPQVNGVAAVFHGHTGVPHPLKYANRVYLDTGGVFNGKMTAAHVDKGKIIAFTTDQYDSCGIVTEL
ncbi:putative serine/threonine protein phosphatase 2 [Pectobacterium phage DU_PP_V]|uniref:Putative serine/threonine protein phosphatase 2 n=1 Tax=Pectobacterium phage DU_PP_V TaxID=2041492 RepID=A0A2D2W6T5_9CAUD|nr:NinI-like serine-threonine phosphatase [Pectobacterium phage DU_PP_V]ATS94009.1 putative serine/threonine protein phosphatase 2 [Pectobacterium phage DU_PP_V]